MASFFSCVKWEEIANLLFLTVNEEGVNEYIIEVLSSTLQLELTQHTKKYQLIASS